FLNCQFFQQKRTFARDFFSTFRPKLVLFFLHLNPLDNSRFEGVYIPKKYRIFDLVEQKGTKACKIAFRFFFAEKIGNSKTTPGCTKP
ncbi:MAG: hypothetical protein AAFV25_01350, partial [Bacteroidota bacterium]